MSRHAWAEERAAEEVPGPQGLILHVSPDEHRQQVIVVAGRDHLLVRTTGYHPLRKIADFYAPGRGPGKEVLVRRLLDAVLEANGLMSENLGSRTDLRIPVLSRDASLTLLLAVAIQKALEREPDAAQGPLDFSNVTFRQGRNCETYLVEIPRWCSRETAGFLVRRLPSPASQPAFEVRF